MMMNIRTYDHLALWATFVLGTLFVLCGSVSAGQYVRVSPDLVIHYEEAGSGQPIIFIPGWTASTVYLRKQINHFSKHYRAIAYDPRSQGLSSKTLENNNYVQHGHDLKAFLDALELNDVILAAHSAGCLDIWSYVRAYGPHNIKAVIAMDCGSPKSIKTQASDAEWTDVVEAKDLIELAQSIAYKRREIMPDFLKSLYLNELPADQLEMQMSMVMQTPDYVASLLWTDADYSDYTEEVKRVDTTVPALWVLAEQRGSTKAKQASIRKLLPHWEVVVLQGKHNLHWEFPEKFNGTVDAFLEKVK